MEIKQEVNTVKKRCKVCRKQHSDQVIKIDIHMPTKSMVTGKYKIKDYSIDVCRKCFVYMVERFPALKPKGLCGWDLKQKNIRLMRHFFEITCEHNVYKHLIEAATQKQCICKQLVSIVKTLKDNDHKKILRLAVEILKAEDAKKILKEYIAIKDKSIFDILTIDALRNRMPWYDKIEEEGCEER